MCLMQFRSFLFSGLVCDALLLAHSPLALAISAAVSDWPDVSQPLQYVTGAAAVGHIEPTGLSREIPDTQEVEGHDFT